MFSILTTTSSPTKQSFLTLIVKSDNQIKNVQNHNDFNRVQAALKLQPWYLEYVWLSWQLKEVLDVDADDEDDDGDDDDDDDDDGILGVRGQ